MSSGESSAERHCYREVYLSGEGVVCSFELVSRYVASSLIALELVWEQRVHASTRSQQQVFDMPTRKSNCPEDGYRLDSWKV
jgi:hypothetical protein